VTETDTIHVIKDVGFPIAVCAWFMLRAEKRLDRIAGLISHMAATNAVIAKTLDIDDDTAKLLEQS